MAPSSLKVGRHSRYNGVGLGSDSLQEMMHRCMMSANHARHLFNVSAQMLVLPQ